MKWLIVVLFATWQGDVYIFTDPHFETRQECMEFIQDPLQIPNLVQKMYEEYEKPMPVQAVNCLEKEEIDRILSGLQKTNLI